MFLSPKRVEEQGGWFVLDYHQLPTATAQALLAIPGVRLTNATTTGLPTPLSEIRVHYSHREVVAAIVGEEIAATLVIPNQIAPLPEYPVGWLRPYQVEGAWFLRGRPGAILADAPGLGKTRQALASWDPAEGLLVVFGPCASWWIWRDEVHARYGIVPLQLRGMLPNPALITPDVKVIYCNFEIAAAWALVIPRPTLVVIDEAHIIAPSPRKQRAAAIIGVAHRARRAIALTATPQWARPYSLWGLLQLVDAWAFGSAHEFGRAYCAAESTQYGWRYEGLSNVEELRTRLDHVMLKRSPDDVALQMPELTRIVEPVELTPVVHARIHSALDTFFRGQATPTRVAAVAARLRRAVAGIKAQRAIQLIQDYVAAGEYVVAWVWHTAVARKMTADLNALGISTACMIGETSEAQRQVACAGLRYGHYQCLVVNLAVGGVSIDLTAARVAVMVELDYSPPVLIQAEGRTWRSTQRAQGCLVTYLVADEPFERSILNILGCKEGYARSLDLAPSTLIAQALLRVGNIHGTSTSVSTIPEYSLNTLAELAASVNTE